MTSIEAFAATIGQSAAMFPTFLADFSDADMLVRPVPNANHAAWQVGHITAGASKMAGMIGITAELPAGFIERFNKSTATVDDPSAFPSRVELITLFTKTHDTIKAGVARLSDADLSRETGMSFAPTYKDILTILGLHPMMHAGQFSVIRRKLGKPVIF